MKPTRAPMILVSGGSRADAPTLALAETVGAEIARVGAVLLTGGLGGVMEAASRGAKMAGGLTVAVVPGNENRAANPHVDIAIASGMAQGRNVILVHSADAVIGLPGAYGTLSETALALDMGKPVITLGGWRPDNSVIVAVNPQDAVAQALSALRED